ncbi:uncharacterized protein LOC118394891 isoform X1 [Oncorhynchus keta]|uniref:uncharacterized protein LOC118394891 isoform X1 n=1 Tax=Oncorhynchus keta TaxID=8018 RepID=UPI0015FAAC70|nr:uncharacterized protein LOC118394891 isoform X1 [Oncorhynchus keta]
MPIKRSQKPGSPKPRSPKPGSPKPGSPKPGSPKPGSPKPGSPKPGSPKPGSPKPGSPKPGSPKPGSPKPGSPKPGSPKPGSPKPGSPKPGSQKLGSQKLGSQKPGSQKPGSQNPGSQKPGNQKTCKKGSTKNGKEWAKKNQDTTRSKELRKSTTDHETCGPIPVMAGMYLDVVRRSAADCESVLPSAQENATLAPGAMELRTGPGGPGAHPRNNCWNNPAENFQACGTSYHICRRPLTDYPVYAHDYTLPRAKDKHQDLYQDESLKRDPSPQGVSLSVTDVDLCNPNVS